MPTAPLRYCASQGCSVRVSSGYCAQHRRKSPRKEGYDSRWDEYSKRRRQQYPLCEGYPKGFHRYPVMAEVTDHIISKRLRPDLFWEPSNHQSLCGNCNRRKAIAEEGGFGRSSV